MKLCVDIDGTLLFTKAVKGATGIITYEFISVNKELISKLNRMYEEGVVVVLQTARHWDKLEITKEQIEQAGIKYTTLIMGNVTADYYINDKSILP